MNDIVSYEGKENYVFISYCREDKTYCMELMRGLADKGVRMWYDNAIKPGEDWPTVIANHLHSCHICLNIITPAFIRSYNCNDELAFAKKHKIPLIPVIVDNTSLPFGVELALNSTQHINASSGAVEETIRAITAVQGVRECMGEVPKPPVEKLWFMAAAFPEKKATAFNKEMIDFQAETLSPAFRDAKLTVQVNKSGGTLHCTGAERAFRDFQELGSGKAQSLSERQTVTVSGQRLFLATGATAENAVRRGSLCVLSCAATRESVCLWDGELVLGRDSCWPKGTLDDTLIDRIHGKIRFDGKQYVLSDSNSLNGTLLNRRFLSPEKESALSDGDTIQLGRTVLTVSLIPIRINNM